VFDKPDALTVRRPTDNVRALKANLTRSTLLWNNSPVKQKPRPESDVSMTCRSVLRLGLSRPWREAMQLMTGQHEFDAEPLLEYFEPLISWLRRQNSGQHVGWQ